MLLDGTLASKNAIKQLIREDELTATELDKLVGIFQPFAAGFAYQVGNILSYNGQLYEVIQSHTSQADWTPDVTPALFKAIAPAGIIPEWVQPTGGHDAYNIGDKVLFEGKVYESLIDANVWSPTAYPAGWTENK